MMSTFNTLEDDFQELVDGMRRVVETRLGSTRGGDQLLSILSSPIEFEASTHTHHASCNKTALSSY